MRIQWNILSYPTIILKTCFFQYNEIYLNFSAHTNIPPTHTHTPTYTQLTPWSDVVYSLNVKRVKKRVNANSLEKEWKPLKNSCYPLEKERNEKKSEIFHSKKSEKRVRVNTSEHHSKMYCPLFNSLKNGHSLAESERHSFSSEYSTILLVLLTIHSKRSEVHSQRVNVSLFKDLNGGPIHFWVVFTRVHFHSFFTLFRVKNLTFFSLFSSFSSG